MNSFKAWFEEHEFIIIVLLVVMLLRVPNLFEPYWYGDEGIYLSVGHGLRAGLDLYAEIIDHKTPLIYWLSAAVGSLLGLKIALIAASLTSITLFYLIARRLFSGQWSVWLSTSAFALLTTLPALEGNIANGEILLMPFILGAIYLFWRFFPRGITSITALEKFYKDTPSWQPLALGILFGLAVLLKVPAGLDAGALALFLLLFVPYQYRRKNWQRMIRYGLLVVAGFLSTILASIAFFYAKGTLQAYFDFGLLYNFRYIEAWGVPFEHPLLIFFTTMTGRLVVVGGLLFGLWLIRKRVSERFLFTVTWFVLTLFAATLSLRPYPHYFIQVLPAASLLLGFLLESGVWGKVSSGILWGVALLILWGLQFHPYPTVSYYQNFYQYIGGVKDRPAYFAWFNAATPDTYRIAAWLKQRTQQYERIFLYGDEPMVYALSERLPVGRYTVMFHITSFRAEAETMEAIYREQPRYILEFQNQGYSFDELEALLQSDYVQVEQIGRATIFRRLDRLSLY